MISRSSNWPRTEVANHISKRANPRVTRAFYGETLLLFQPLSLLLSRLPHLRLFPLHPILVFSTLTDSKAPRGGAKEFSEDGRGAGSVGGEIGGGEVKQNTRDKVPSGETPRSASRPVRRAPL